MAKTTPTQQYDLAVAISKETARLKQLDILRKFLVENGYEEPANSDEALAALRARLMMPECEDHGVIERGGNCVNCGKPL